MLVKAAGTLMMTVIATKIILRNPERVARAASMSAHPRGDGRDEDRDNDAQARVCYTRGKRTLKARGDGEEHPRVSNARCKRSSTKPGATPQVHNH